MYFPFNKYNRFSYCRKHITRSKTAEADNGVVWLCSAKFRFTHHLRLRTQEKTAYIRLMRPHQAISCLMYQIFINPCFLNGILGYAGSVFKRIWKWFLFKKNWIDPSWNRKKTFGSMKWIYSPYQISPL